jgi:hypothetical protein
MTVEVGAIRWVSAPPPPVPLELFGQGGILAPFLTEAA